MSSRQISQFDKQAGIFERAAGSRRSPDVRHHARWRADDRGHGPEWESAAPDGGGDRLDAGVGAACAPGASIGGRAFGVSRLPRRTERPLEPPERPTPGSRKSPRHPAIAAPAWCLARSSGRTQSSAGSRRRASPSGRRDRRARGPRRQDGQQPGQPEAAFSRGFCRRSWRRPARN